MRTIKLYGELGEKFGKTFELEVLSPAEAIRALCVLIKGFEEYLLGSEKNGVGFKVFDTDNQLGERDLGLRGSGVIKLVPVIGGANGETRIIIGAVLVAASLVMTATGFGAGAAPYVMNAGVALMLGGAIEMIAGRPKTPEISEKPENKPSYLFSGAVNTTAQGHPVPLGYGRMIVGSAVISASMSTQNLLAGYVKKYREIFKEATAYGTENQYMSPPPPGYHRRELIDSGNSNLYGSIYAWWRYKFYYWEEYMELAPV